MAKLAAIEPRSIICHVARARTWTAPNDITVHDLWRTAANYVPKGSTTESVYNRYEYDAEKRSALEASFSEVPPFCWSLLFSRRRN